MEYSFRTVFTIVHGLFFGGLFLMGLYGLLIESYRWKMVKSYEVPKLNKYGLKIERIYVLLITAMGWIVAISGAYIIYPWYRSVPPTGATNLTEFPKYYLLSNSSTAFWHSFGMEWKEHIAWIAAICLTSVSYLFIKHRDAIENNPQIRSAVRGLLFAAFFSAAVAGFFGAMINKIAPIHGGSIVERSDLKP